MPHQVTIAAYNAAGELVKIIYQGAAQYLPGDLKLSDDRFIGGSAGVTIQFPGLFATGSNTVAWTGMNDSAMLVQGGVYTIKAEITDQWGQTTSLVKSVEVIPGGIQQSLRIYNSAGELVRVVPISTPVTGATRLDLAVGTDSYALEIDPATGKAKQPLQVDVIGNGGASPQTWDGLNDAGVPVASGTYSIQLVSNEGGQSTVVMARSLTVIKIAEDATILANAVVGPNPATSKDIPQIVYDPSSLAPERSCNAIVYNLAGEYIGRADDPNRSGRISLPLEKAQASGIYLVRFTVQVGSAIVESRLLKLAILR
jgi:hypothetical protein